MNEQTHFFIKIYLSHFILKRVDVVCVLEMSWRWGQTAIYWPSSTSFSSCLGCSTVGHSVCCCWLSIRHLVSNWLRLSVCLVILLFNAHLLPLFFHLFTQVHLLIDGSVKGQYVTIWLLVNIYPTLLPLASCNIRSISWQSKADLKSIFFLLHWLLY